MKQLKLSFFTGIICSAFTANAQENKSIWQTVQVPVKLSDKFIWHNDAGYRTIQYSFSARQVLYRTGLRYHFTKRTNVAAGLALFFTRTSLEKQNHEFGRENRLWQELVHQQSLLHNTSLQLRFRTEQRFFNETSKQKAFHAFRFRCRINLQQQLNEKWLVQFGYEHMHQLANQKFEFNQLRIQPALLYKFNEAVHVQAMYMHLKAINEKQQAFWITYFLNINHANRKQSKN
jgi:hypothetical protein